MEETQSTTNLTTEVKCYVQLDENGAIKARADFKWADDCVASAVDVLSYPDGQLYFADKLPNVYAKVGTTIQVVGDAEKDNPDYVLMQGVKPEPVRAGESLFGDILVDYRAQADGTWLAFDMHNTNLERRYKQAVTEALDAFARMKDYDNMSTVCSYSGSSNPTYAREAAYCSALRDATWNAAYAIIGEIIEGTSPEVTVDAFVHVLPVATAEWPTA